MTMNAHTPTPWNFGNPTGVTGPTVASIEGPTVAGRDWGFEIVTQGYETLCICPNQGINLHSEVEGSGSANAAFIVRAVNAYEGLVAALTEITNVSAGGPHISAADGLKANWSALMRCRELARNALAKMEA